MTQSPRFGQVITFYSYKGGVGRSMAVANVATLLAQAQRKVLVIDFDLEAPGLHRYFPPPDGEGESAGTIDFFTQLRTRLQALAGPPEWSEAEQALAPFRAVIEKLVRDSGFVREAWVKSPIDGKDYPLHLMPAGGFGNDYPDLVRRFDWLEFYRAHPYVFQLLAHALSSEYDYILIDSRTGLTDVGGICTVLLPQKLVLVFTPNRQSMIGVVEVAEQAIRQRKEHPSELRPLAVFPLLSRVENAETILQEEWIERGRRAFQMVFEKEYALPNCNLKVYFEAAQIPHRSFYAYGEVIAVQRESHAKQGSLAAAFRSFAECLQQDDVLAAQRLLTPQAVGSVAIESNLRVAAAEEQARRLAEELQAQKGLAIQAANRGRRLSQLTVGAAVLLVVVGLATGYWFIKSQRPDVAAIVQARSNEILATGDPSRARHLAEELNRLVPDKQDPRLRSAWTHVAMLELTTPGVEPSTVNLTQAVTGALGAGPLAADSPPMVVRASKTLGDLYLKGGRYQEAVDIYDKVVPVQQAGKDPTVVDTLIQKARALEQSRDVEGALATLRLAEQEARNRQDSKKVAEILRTEVGLWAPNASRFLPQIRTATQELAGLYDQLKRPEDRRAVLEQRGDLLARAGDVAGASEAYKAARAAGSGSKSSEWPVLAKVARLALAKKQKTSAITSYLAALEAMLDDPKPDLIKMEEIVDEYIKILDRASARDARKALKWKAANPARSSADWIALKYGQPR
jgi:cellulose biosynthesis protein BcsQ